jgi:hypothetical protein
MPGYAPFAPGYPMQPPPAVFTQPPSPSKEVGASANVTLEKSTPKRRTEKKVGNKATDEDEDAEGDNDTDGDERKMEADLAN